ncbi:MAG: hypothetical protein GXZ11_08915 [Tissierellia bacterium]|nr:hypothetical protein [Tissierellia bacterium]
MKKKNNDIMVTILAVIIAILLRSYVVDKENPEKTVEYKNIPVEFFNQSTLDRKNISIMSPSSATVNVKVSGRIRDINSADAIKITASVDLDGYSEGKVNVPINVKLLGSPAGVRIVSHEPKSVLFDMEQNIVRSKPVVVSPVGEPAQGHILKESTSSITMVTINGPRSYVNQVAKIIAAVDINGWKETNTITAELIPVDEEGITINGVNLEVNRADVTVSIDNVKGIPIAVETINRPGQNLVVSDIIATPNLVEISGQGETTALAAIKTAPLDLSTLTESGETTLKLIFPKDVEPVNPNHVSVKVKYKVEEVVSDSKSVQLEKVRISGNATRSTEWVNPPEGLELSVRGLKKNVETLDFSGLSFHVEISDELGEQDVPVIVDGMPDEIEWSITPPNLKVLVSE